MCALFQKGVQIKATTEKERERERKESVCEQFKKKTKTIKTPKGIRRKEIRVNTTSNSTTRLVAVDVVEIGEAGKE